jgi:replicative DNA helicase
MNLEAERGALSAFINLDDFAHTLPIKINEEDFDGSTNKVIAKVILQIINSGQQPTKNLIISTATTLAIDDFDEHTKDGEILDEIINLKPTKDEALTYIRQIKKESIKRTAKIELKSLYNYIETTDAPLKEILTKFEDTVLKVTSSTDFAENDAVKLADIIDKELDFIGTNPGNKGLDLGMPYWQKRVGGMANGLVHMVIATHKTGKSNIGFNAAKEIALDQFIAGHIGFMQMAALVEATLDRLSAETRLGNAAQSLEDVLAMDHLARVRASELAQQIRIG